MSFLCLPAQGARPMILGPDRGKRDIRVRVKEKGGRVRDERAYRYWYWYCWGKEGYSDKGRDEVRHRKGWVGGMGCRVERA